jgi:hypothetical protein
MIFPRGKLPARHAISFKFASILNTAKLPVVPTAFGDVSMPNWFMLGNDEWGDCVPVAAAHEHMKWTLEGGSPRMPITTADVLLDYGAVTGFNRYIPFSDRGTDMQAMAKYRCTVGVRDALGNRHKSDIYLEVTPNSPDDLAVAAYLNGAVSIGLNLPNDADEVFLAGKPWEVSGSPSGNGHCVTVIGRRANGNFVVVTWGREQEMSPDYFTAYNDEVVACISTERLKNGKSPEAFDLPTIENLINSIGLPAA